jgi:photosystem II stability/assembly factor-like uncharacterized protein
MNSPRSLPRRCAVISVLALAACDALSLGDARVRPGAPDVDAGSALPPTDAGSAPALPDAAASGPTRADGPLRDGGRGGAPRPVEVLVDPPANCPAVPGSSSPWQPVLLGRNPLSIYAALVGHPSDPNHLATLGPEGLWVSRTAGRCWTRGGPLPSSPVQIAWSAGEPARLHLLRRPEGQAAELMISRDEGLTWSSVGALPDGTTQVALHPTDPKIAYALGRIGEGARFALSRDGGASWTAVPLPPAQDDDVEHLLTSRGRPDEVYLWAEDEEALARLLRYSPKTGEVAEIRLDFHDDDLGVPPVLDEAGRLFLTIRDGVVRSDDGARSFQKLPAPNLWHLFAGGGELVGFPFGPPRILLGRDGGAAFDEHPLDGLQPLMATSAGAGPAGAAIYLRAGTADRRVALLRSTVESWTWRQTATSLDLSWPTQLSTTSAGALLALFPSRVGPYSAVLARSEDRGETWTTRNLPPGRLTFHPTEADVLFLERQERGLAVSHSRSEDGGRTWQAWPVVVPTPEGHVPKGDEPQIVVRELLVAPGSPTHFYGWTELVRTSDRAQLVALVVSEDGGRTWACRPTPGFWRPLAASPSDPRVLYAAGSVGELLATRDAGRTWESRRVPALETARISAAAVAPGAPGALFVVFAGGHLARSADGGATWILPRGLEPDPSQATNDALGKVVVHPADPRVVYAAGAHVYKSQDGGLSFRRVIAGLPKGTTDALAVDPTAPDTVYRGGAWIYRTTTGGE